MNVNVSFVKTYDDNSYTIRFRFPELYSYEVPVFYDKYGYVNNIKAVEEIVRLLNAANLFRQWDKESYYTTEELRRCIEDVYRTNVENAENPVHYKEYRLAIPTSEPKAWNKILIEQ